MKNIFITGISSGAGEGLAKYYSSKGVNVYGISRRELSYSHENIFHKQIDIAKATELMTLKDFLPTEIDLVILNAGVLGKMSTMKDADLNELRQTMDINLWSQKEILDIVIEHTSTKKIIGVSSGKAISGNVGWSGYCLSKAAFNMLIQLYADEYKEIKFVAFAPGLVDTPMQEHLCEDDEPQRFPNMKRLKAARGTKDMPSPQKFAKMFDEKLDQILSVDSGSYVDLRKL
jgi:NAD(P)-dependent dehydrogenase (short-subunit alcohol dehydrogenase family)